MTGPARTWVDGPGGGTPINAARLNGMETDIATGVDSSAKANGFIQGARDPLAYLDQVKLLCQFPVRENGEVSWPQGFSINKAADEIYVSNQNGTELRLDVRTLSTGVRKSSKIITTDDLAFSEGLPWFYNGSGNLCFFVRPAGGTPAQSAFYAIYNYTTAALGPRIAINGGVKADVQGNYLITSDAWTYTVSQFYIYDWTSVQAGTPSLLATIGVENTAATAGKNQGVAVVGNHFFLLQGAQTESPTITAYDFTGKLKTVRQYKLPDFYNTVNALVPGLLTNPAYLYECESGTNLDGKLVSAQIVNNTPAVTANGVVLILQHGSVDGVAAVSSVVPSYVFDSGWVTLTLVSGWTVGSIPPAVRRIGSHVMFKGDLINAATTANTWTAGFTLDAQFRPASLTQMSQTSNTTTTMTWRINSSGIVEFWSSAATGAWRPINGANFFLA